MRNRFLRIYLHDHLAMAWAGIDFSRRVLKQNRDNELGRRLEIFIEEIEEEAAALEDAMALVDVERSQFKTAGARLAEKAGLLKFNGQIIRYSPLSRVLELEFLLAAVQVRKGLWSTLREASKMYPELDQVATERYRDRADQQLGRIESLHQRAVRAMLKEGWDKEQRHDRPPAP